MEYREGLVGPRGLRGQPADHDGGLSLRRSHRRIGTRLRAVPGADASSRTTAACVLQRPQPGGEFLSVDKVVELAERGDRRSAVFAGEAVGARKSLLSPP